jgi:hypothetical protein
VRSKENFILKSTLVAGFPPSKAWHKPSRWFISPAHVSLPFELPYKTLG